ncbi:helix-turn-helix domain-containing protein [Alicyclobacillus macrosporangiidus]|uniref:helix-turn-helix domain-containing protein n=1 Tax=Alicyclobacillus macrosporangiidus TaxID=392015 RepID=UPI00068AA20E|nr:helix-turn-helix domain-containing protein [Alicyclobacillus macrosporangiidus]
MASIGEKVAYLREQRGWTLKELSDRSGVSVSHISAIENGTRPNPSIDRVKRIAHAFGVSLAYFDDDAPAPDVVANELPPSVPSGPSSEHREGSTRLNGDPVSSPASNRRVDAAAEGQGGDPDMISDVMDLAKRIQALYDHETARFIASESSRPYVALARQLAEQDLLHDAPHLLQVIAQFIRDRAEDYGTADR